MAYRHGAYGERTVSQVKSAKQAKENVVYFGTAPINLIRGYDDADLVNVPVKLKNLGEAQSKVGYSDRWDGFTLCEAIDYHFNNTTGNIGPIYIVNVLDPDTHRKSSSTTKAVPFSNGSGSFVSDAVILDTIAIEDKTEGVDYTIEYDFDRATVTIKSLIDTDQLSGTVDVSFFEIDLSLVTSSTIIGQHTASGIYTGIASVALLYMRENAVPNILAAPGWSEIPAVYKALCSAAQKINGHWDAFVNADIPIKEDSTAIETISQAIRWKEINAYTSPISKVGWPMVQSGNKIYHMSTVMTAKMLEVDLEHDAVPFESCSNKNIMATDQYFGAESANQGFDQTEANELNENGITTLCYWDGSFKLWGPHTAGYIYNDSIDASAIFETNMRMLMFITNGFQLRNGVKIDAPMTPNDRDSIVVSEQAELDSLVGIGALIGSPEVLFLETENTESDMINGDFVWHIMATPTPPLKSATAKVTYTDEGFSSFFGEEG
ncbi:MAG: phage tail sheath family protein [Lachnospiraceae bacterium]|nr:phage tail sheath family protein [Lachnospiraceae bacterium]